MSKQIDEFDDGISDEYLEDLEKRYGKPDPNIGGLFGPAEEELIQPKKKKFIALKVILTLLVAVVVTGGIIVGWMYFHESYDKMDNWAVYNVGDGEYADVFVVGATTNEGSKNYSYKEARESEAYNIFLSEKKDAFVKYCRMFAPYYRQADKGIVTGTQAKESDDMNLAYKDVKSAFEYYMEHENNGRPIILAGYEQGGEMVLRLLKDYFDEEYRTQLVAAYVCDWAVEQADLKGYLNLHLSNGSSDVGAIITEEEDISNRIQAYFRDSITTQADFVNALGGLEYASAKDNVITLKQDVVLDKTLVIAQGTYTLVGNGYSITRNMEEDLISIVSAKGAQAKLVLGKKDGSDTLILDGNYTEYAQVEGALIGVYGNAILDIYDGVTLQNNSRITYDGGAVYAECSYEEKAEEEGMYICHEPTVNIYGGLFQNNKTTLNGGAIALIGAYSEKEKLSFGILNIYKGTFINNTALSGMQVYTEKGTLSYTDEVGFLEGDVVEQN